MNILDSPYTDPRYNIAAEEYLLKETEDDYAFFYVNSPSIIIGKHQNSYSEFNLEYIRSNQIPVIRRISGGGTVWHDTGNLNFSFILNGEEGKLVNFREYAQPVVDFLNNLGVEASFGSRNEILVEGFKISGNAEHIHRNRVLHHGTLLFNSDLDALKRSLLVEQRKYQDKAVQSVRSPVANIRKFLGGNKDMTGFRSSLIRYFLDTGTDTSPLLLQSDAVRRIRELAEDKYSSWEWNFGYSPKYKISRKFTFEGVAFTVELYVERGMISQMVLESDGPDQEVIEEFTRRLKGERHDPDLVNQLCIDLEIVKPEHIDKFVNQLF